ncbi:MAG: hypothetical protein WCY41_06210, partial [Candidatus Micrarchaeia archaeon]
AVVLIVALVSVALLGFFPGMAADARITQSQSYWRGQARPFAILDAGLSGAAANLSVQNMEANGPYVLTSMTIGGAAVTITGTNATFAAGETKTLVVTAGIPTCTSASVYDYNVTISYTTPNGVTGKQYGTKNLIGKCI